jgi:DNA-binding IclR family transcriptional regulator
VQDEEQARWKARRRLHQIAATGFAALSGETEADACAVAACDAISVSAHPEL